MTAAVVHCDSGGGTLWRRWRHIMTAAVINAMGHRTTMMTAVIPYDGGGAIGDTI
jgi:hypothetical protein